MEGKIMEKVIKPEKHFVLIHGICHRAWCWYKVKTLLEYEGHRVTALDLAASGVNMRKIEEVGTFANYSQPLIEFLELIPQEEKVILVGHSFGGISLALAWRIFYPGAHDRVPNAPLTRCERNWSTFDRIHTKIRNRLLSKNLNDLVFVQYNIHLERRREDRRRRYRVDPISVSAILLEDPLCEWIAEDDDDPLLPTHEEWPEELERELSAEDPEVNK
ncbi:hypothetical protein GIB67_032761 [Kingdonia uniflora]|uniref:AB hydrolase-1 domain-containing protein n=1 Tax=Kingdonia uniflora TaxID=39325 RepID=A0A7J7MWD0_9MAGN|nr:hypothetical protein GIB67_032761 [Kingdonia uniflora]